MKKSYLTKTLLAITLIAVMCFSIVAFVGCNAGCYINAPETLEAELGVYVVPDYDVVNSNGMIMSGFDVRLKSVTDAKGQKIDFDQNSVTITEKGVYKFVYGAKGVKDATVNVDFADRTAPTVNFNANNLPSFFITGNSYRIPAYTLSGDYVREKCTVKVVHIADDKKETEVEIKSNRFDVTETSGSYEIRIHVEDAAGNVRNYAYSRPVDGPEAIKENTIIYFDEPFGERQVYCLENGYTGQYVSNEVLGDKAREGDNGAYKVTFTGAETTNNEGYISLKTPAILDVNGYTELEMYVYNDSENDAIFGATWWNDTTIKKGEWTRISFSVDNWGHCTWADNSTKIVSTGDVSNMGLRFIFAYDHQTLPSGTFYLSPLRGIPRIPAEVTVGEDVTLDKSSYSIGGVVNLTAAEKTGKAVDCFLVDGKPIAGNSFVVTEAQHTVTVKYADELTFDTMTWATGFHYPVPNNNWMTANFMGATYVGDSDKWVISTDVIGGYNENTGGQTMNLTWMIGDIESIELQLNKESGVIKWYFAGGNNWNTPVTNLSNAQFNKLKNASEQDPVNVTVMRNGDLLLITIDGEYVGRCEIKNGLSSNAFGIGYRKEGADKPDTVLLANTKAVMGEERTELYYSTLNAAIDKENDNVSTDKQSYRLGDVVTLTAKEAGNGQVFGYFTLDGGRIIGNSFVVTKRSHTVGAVYVTLSAVTFENGVTAAEGNSVGLGTNLTLSHGEAPEQGKVFDYYLVDGQIKVYGNVFTVTDTEHTISAVWVDAADFTWGGADERYTCDKIMGSDASVWQNRGLVGYVFGSSEYWAVKVDVKHITEWNSFEFVQGTKQSIRVRFHQGNYFGIIVITDNGSEWTPDGHSEFVHAFPNQNPDMVAKLLAGTTITCVRYGDTITMYADNVPFFTTDYAVDHTGNWFGVGHVNANDATAPEMTNVQFIMGKDKVDAHLETLKATFTKTDVTTDKDEYRIGDTVTLTAAPAPEGKKFSHFEVDDVRISGNTFVVTKSAHKLVAVYSDISAIELGAGITTADGETEYARGATVTLTYEKSALNGKLFNYFTVDGNRIVGNTFVTTAANHVIAIITADTADELTWVNNTEAQTSNVAYSGGGYTFNGVSMGESDHWVINAQLGALPNFATGDTWIGFDILVGTNATIQIRLHTSGIVDIRAMGTQHGDGNTEIGEILNKASVISKAKQATDANPLQLTVIRNGKSFYVLFDSELTLKSTFDFKGADNKFGIGATNCGTWLPLYEITKYQYRIGEEIAASKTTSKVTGTNVTLDKADGVYTLGDTVTLGHGEAELGYAFSYYKVNGEKINGNSFAAVKAEYTVEAVFENIADTYRIDVDGPTNTIFIQDGQLILPIAAIKDGNGDIVSGYAITTTVTDTTGRSFEVSDGVANINYKGAIALTIKYSCAGLEGKDKEFTVLVQDEDGTVLTADEVGASVVKANEYSDIEYSTEQVCSETGDSGAIKITVTALDGNQVYGYIPFDFADGKYVEFYVYDTTPDSSDTKVIGCHWYGDTRLTHGAWTKVRLNLLNNEGKVSNVEDGKGWRIRFVNVAVGDVFYISSMKLGSESTQLTDISQWKQVSNITAAEYVTDVKYDGNDVAVTEIGSLKVTVGSSDNGLASTQNNVTDLSGYSAVYFYVYTEAASAQSGAYWCGDTALVAGQWTKVYLTSALANGGPWNADNSKIFEAGLKDMVVRIMGCSAGDVFYVTSLYGIPKA